MAARFEPYGAPARGWSVLLPVVLILAMVVLSPFLYDLAQLGLPTLSLP